MERNSEFIYFFHDVSRGASLYIGGQTPAFESLENAEWFQNENADFLAHYGVDICAYPRDDIDDFERAGRPMVFLDSSAALAVSGGPELLSAYRGGGFMCEIT